MSNPAVLQRQLDSVEKRYAELQAKQRHTPLSRAELRELAGLPYTIEVRRLHAQGLSAKEIAARRAAGRLPAKTAQATPTGIATAARVAPPVQAGVAAAPHKKPHKKPLLGRRTAIGAGAATLLGLAYAAFKPRRRR